MSSTWTFTQLRGDQKKLVLSGHAAPHGGPRRGSVVEDGLTVRMDEVYLGTSSNVGPVRHLFGSKFDAIKLEGYWSDRYGGKDFAKNKKLEVKRFVDDAQPVAIVWDDLFAGTGIIEKILPKIEGPGDIAWEMHIRMDSDDLLAFDASPEPQQRQPADFVNQIVLASTEILDKIPTTPSTLNSGFLGTLASLVDDVNSFTSAAVSIAATINDMATAPFALLRRFRLGLEQLKTAVVILRDTYDQVKIDAALESAQANDATEFWDVQTAWSSSSVEILRQIADAQRSTALAEIGRTKAYYVAQTGDTWEKISAQFYQSAERADDIRGANGVEAGSAPIPGATYRIPN